MNSHLFGREDAIVHEIARVAITGEPDKTDARNYFESSWADICGQISMLVHPWSRGLTFSIQLVVE